MKWIERLMQLCTSKKWRSLRSRGFKASAAVVVFVTTYMLILPALTQSTEYFCGKEEHTHGEACWLEDRVLVCTKEEGVGHTHSAECYEVEEELTCGKQESAGHHHSDSCYETEKVLTCSNEDEEHQHDDSCYTKEKYLVCGETESDGHTHSADCYTKTEKLVCGMDEGKAHTHNDSCYEVERTLICGIEEHEHTASCFSDPTADVETPEAWMNTFRNVELTGNWSEDVLAIAHTQLGYKESTANYILEGSDKKGYTRYGAWYGNAYGDWCAMFVSFCINYAEVPTAPAENVTVYFPVQASCQQWIELLNRKETPYYYAVDDRNNYDLVNDPAGFVPQAGDLIFFNWDSLPDSDHVGLVVSVELDENGQLKKVHTLEGNSGDTVRFRDYKGNDGNIMGYARMPQNPALAEEEIPQETENTGLAYTAEVEDYTVTVTYPEGTEIPEGAVLTAETAASDDEMNAISEFLAKEYSYTEAKVFNLQLTQDGEAIAVEAPVQVDIAAAATEENPTGEQLILQLGEEPMVLASETTTADGSIHCTYSQESLGQAALVNGAKKLHTLSYEGEDYTINVSFTDDANLPANVELAVSEILGEEYEERCNEINEVVEEQHIEYVRVFDITFLADGVEIEPAAPVQVQIIRKDLPELDEGMESGIVHFGEEEAEVIDSELGTDEEGNTTFEFEGNTFSQYASYVSDPFGETGTPPTIATVDTVATGLTINMFDYWGDNTKTPDPIDEKYTNGSGDFVNGGVNKWGNVNTATIRTKLLFSASGASFGDEGDAIQHSLNAFTGNNKDIAGSGGAARQGIVNTTLTNGYPTLATDGSSLDYLFNLSDTTYKKTYANLNHLFKADAPSDGYITYNSNQNYAYLDQASRNFKVYDGTFNNVDGSLVGFFPFNPYNENYKEVVGPDDNEDYYNHHFGMTLSGSFIIPDNKKVNNQDMIFTFSGDDDMWLFIDGVLALDIGGIHEPCSGTINLTNGEISISAAAKTIDQNGNTLPNMGTSNNFFTLYKAATGKDWNNNVDTEHTIQMFYMERGGCYSNLIMTMNLPMISPISVMKAVQGEEQDAIEDNDYKFQVMVETHTGSNVFEAYTGVLKVTNGTTSREITPDANGYFQLKAGETATTKKKFLSSKKYYVNEIDVDGNVFEGVLINGNDVTPELGTETESFSVYGNAIPALFVGTMSTVTNVMREKKTGLTVTKVWYDGATADHDGDVVKFKVIQTDETGTSKDLVYDGENVFELRATGWTKTFENLVKKTASHTYSYSVEEIEVEDGYTAKYSKLSTDEDGNGYITITNGPEVNIKVQKKWYRADGVTEIDGETISNAGIQVQLKRSGVRERKYISHTVTFKVYQNDQTWRTLSTTYSVGEGGLIYFNAYSGSNGTSEVKVEGAGTWNGYDSKNAWKVIDIRGNITIKIKLNTDLNTRDRVTLNINQRTEPYWVEAVNIESENVGDPVELNKENGWTYEWGKNETPAISSDGISYTYFVEEIGTSNAYTVTYDNNNGIVKGDITVKNKLYEYDLPKTGGIGTKVYTMGGIGMILGSLVLYGFSLRRRRERRVR